MTVHKVETNDVYFDAIVRGEKTFDVQRDDRGFQKGDSLQLIRMEKSLSGIWHDSRDPSTYSQITALRHITYILTSGQFGIEPGYVVLGLKE